MGRELANLAPGFGSRRQGGMDINLSWILISPPKKTCGTKRVYINLSENDSGKDLSHAITRSSWQHPYSIGYIV